VLVNFLTHIFQLQISGVNSNSWPLGCKSTSVFRTRKIALLADKKMVLILVLVSALVCFGCQYAWSFDFSFGNRSD
jgi:hypothetical protein